MAQNGRRRADEVLLLALACGATAETAAHKASIGVATVYRRLKDPDFIRRLQKVRADMVQRAAGSLTAAAMEAIKTLLALLQASNSGPVRLGAARAILELGTKLRESVELEQRIVALEQKADGRKGN
jgi:HEAT repeat protein